MRVISKVEQEAKRVICTDCGSELEYEHDDVYIGQYGCGYTTCPVCDEEIFLEDYDTPELTVNTVQWPQHFALPNDRAVDINDERIQEYIDKCLKHLNKSEDSGDFATMGSGNTLVIVHKYEDEYQIIVSKSYADTYIPR